MNKTQTLIMAALLAISPLALANHDAMGEHCNTHNHKSFDEADADHDGTLDKEEFKVMCMMNFDKMDSDQDGTISKEELATCRSHRHHKASTTAHEKHSKEFSSADTDNDGTLTKQEAKKLPRVYKNFNAIDVDNDGTVDRDEVHNFMHEHNMK
jgi:Ca2+-binding EF-hand superfamily protein